MPKNFSDALKANLIRTTADESPLYLLTIDNTILSNPIRLVRDNCDIVSNGLTYTSCGFDLVIPDEKAKEASKASISINNISRTLTRYFEQLQGGGSNTTALIQIITRSTPDVVEVSYDMDLDNVTITKKTITANLTFDRVLQKRACNVIYDKFTSPGLF